MSDPYRLFKLAEFIREQEATTHAEQASSRRQAESGIVPRFDENLGDLVHRMWDANCPWVRFPTDYGVVSVRIETRPGRGLPLTIQNPTCSLCGVGHLPFTTQCFHQRTVQSNGTVDAS